MPSQSRRPAKVAKTPYRESVEYLANFATELEDHVEEHPILPFMVFDAKKLAQHIRRILHGARG